MRDRYHYTNGSIADCDWQDCPIEDHGSLLEMVRAMREDPFQAPYTRPSGGTK